MYSKTGWHCSTKAFRCCSVHFAVEHGGYSLRFFGNSGTLQSPVKFRVGYNVKVTNIVCSRKNIISWLEKAFMRKVIKKQFRPFGECTKIPSQDLQIAGGVMH